MVFRLTGILMIDGQRITEVLEKAETIQSDSLIKDVLAKARLLKGLEESDVAVLMGISSHELLNELYETASWIKERIYGRRLVFFAPLYISNMCNNECLYCAFRAANKKINRRALTQLEIAYETKMLLEQGHKRILMVAGESYPKDGFKYIIDSINTIYSVKSDLGEIRRVNVNIAPLSVDEFRQLKAADIGTFQLFQETYHLPTYKRVHLKGRKTDYEWRITGMDRAIEAGIDDVGIGVLFGLADWRFEILALLQHIRHLEARWGVGPHTISVPRMEPAVGSVIAEQPPHPVSDQDFKKIVAILRLMVPYTGLIMSTRETAKMRRETFALGVSQISAGSRTNPGGYSTSDGEEEASQFCLGDHRPLDEVVRDVAAMGYIPSFCTACYRLGRTGRDFMDLAKPGEIKAHCEPNALSTFQEYLEDFASPVTKQIGEKLIQDTLNGMTADQRSRTEAMIRKARNGEHDVFC